MVEPKLDPRVVRQIREVGGEPLLRDLLQTFLENAPRRLRSLRDGLRSSDAEAVALAAHSLRSAAASIGAPELSRCAGEVEERARRGETELAGPVAELERAVVTSVGEFRLYLDAAKR